MCKIFLTITQISEQDKGLPTRLCSDCIGRLKTAFDFKYQCLEAEKFLITYINEANQKLDEVLYHNMFQTLNVFI